METGKMPVDTMVFVAKALLVKFADRKLPVSAAAWKLTSLEYDADP